MSSARSGRSGSLAERLGYGPEDRLLIVNCDDLGSSHGANIATFKAMTEGIASSATLMVPCPWAKETAEMFRGFPVGVHLTLTSEHTTGYRWRGLTGGASLHDEEGFLPATAEPALERLEPEDARVECRAQIEAALSWGVDVTHLDAHMNVMQGRSDLYEVYLDLAETYRVPVRMWSREESKRQGFWARERATVRGVLFPDHIIYPWPRRSRDVLFEQIPSLPAGVTEIFLHPVEDGEELRAYDVANPEIRVHDAACLTDLAVSDLLDRHNVRRLSFREIRDLQRAHR